METGGFMQESVAAEKARFAEARVQDEHRVHREKEDHRGRF
jgi:hypothetical protein